MKHFRIIVLTIMITLMPLSSFGIKYSHDAAVMNQFLRMELGTGAWVPAWYYNTVHKKYKRGFGSGKYLPKLASRSAMAAYAHKQVDKADSIKRNLEKMSADELKKSITRSIDMSYHSVLGADGEGKKIDDKLQQLSKDITILNGMRNDFTDHTLNDYYKSRFDGFCEERDILHKSYMPAGGRKAAYSELYNAISATCSVCESAICDYYNMQKLDEFVRYAYTSHRAKPIDVVQGCVDNWVGAIRKTTEELKSKSI